jgi:hypothetical protein
MDNDNPREITLSKITENHTTIAKKYQKNNFKYLIILKISDCPLLPEYQHTENKDFTAEQTPRQMATS